MKKAWSVIMGIVLVTILLGGICIAVGYVTGGNTETILSVLDAKYHMRAYLEAYIPYLQQVVDGLANAWQAA